MDLELIRKRCRGGRFVITTRTSPAGAAAASPGAPCGRLGLAGNPPASGASLLRAPWELSVVLGERPGRRRPEGRDQERERGDTLRKESLARTVQPATLRPTAGTGGGGVPSGSSRRRETADLLFQCQRPVIPPSLGKHGPLTLYASSPKPWGCLTCRRKRGTQAPTPMGTEEG